MTRKEYQAEWLRRKRAADKKPVDTTIVDTESVDNILTDVDRRLNVDTPQTVDNPWHVYMTTSDKKFDQSRPHYFIFDAPKKDRTCLHCNKKFSTHLDLNRFCSPSCKTSFLDHAFRAA